MFSKYANVPVRYWADSCCKSYCKMRQSSRESVTLFCNVLYCSCMYDVRVIGVLVVTITEEIKGEAKMSSFQESSLFPSVSLSLSTSSVECMYLPEEGGGL